MLCFRLTPERNRADSFDGIGASTYPGRWNERHRRAVYVTTRLPLGILEIMVQDSVTQLRGYGAYPVEIPDDIALEILDPAVLSAAWRTSLAGRAECRKHGEAWLLRAAGVGLVVPSAVVPEAFAYGDYNVVLNPAHPDFARLEVGVRIDLAIDPRLPFRK